MSEQPTLDFFDRLEIELRRAAERSPRSRLWQRPRAIATLAAGLAVAALALIPIVLVGGDGRTAKDGAGPGLSPVGSILPKGSGDPPLRHTSMVVGRAEESPAGPWQLEVFRYGSPNAKAGEARPGYCLMLYLPSTPGNGRPGRGGPCGPRKRQLGSRGTPGFALGESVLPPRRPRMVMAFGRAPRHASKVVVTFPGRPRLVANLRPAPPGFKRRYGFDASFYAVVLRTTAVRGARVNWLDASGRPGSRGIPLIPPPR
jgi:hypothetical protein